MWDKTRSISCMEEKFPNFALVIPKKNFEAVTKSNNQIMSKAMEIKWEQMENRKRTSLTWTDDGANQDILQMQMSPNKIEVIKHSHTKVSLTFLRSSASCL